MAQISMEHVGFKPLILRRILLRGDPLTWHFRCVTASTEQKRWFLHHNSAGAMADFCYMGLLRILTNSLCTLGARPQLPHVYPDSTGIRIFPLAKRFGVDSTEAMIRPGFLDPESRRDLIELARDGSAAHRLARRANALVLLDKGMSCQSVAEVLLLDGDTIRSWCQLYQQDGIEGLASFGHEGGSCRLTVEQQDRLKAWIAETLPRTTRAVGAWIARECGIEYQTRSGLIALLHRI